MPLPSNCVQQTAAASRSYPCLCLYPCSHTHQLPFDRKHTRAHVSTQHTHITPVRPAGNHAFETWSASVRHVKDPKLQAVLWLQAEASRHGYAHTQGEMVRGAALRCRGWQGRWRLRHSAGWRGAPSAVAAPGGSPHVLYVPYNVPHSCSTCAAYGSTWKLTRSCGLTPRPSCATTAPTSATPVSAGKLPGS